MQSLVLDIEFRTGDSDIV